MSELSCLLSRINSKEMGKRILITGSTGMVGKGVLLQCLQNSSIEEVVVVNRSKLGMEHSKLKEVLLSDFSKPDSIQEQLGKIDACFYCMGVSSAGMNEEKFSALTFDFAKAFADVLFVNNPEMTVVYVSGQGTDSSEKGRIMWARVKGKTENYFFDKGFKSAYAFRPGIILPENGLRSRTTLYNVGYVILTPFFPLLRKMKSVTTTTRLGNAMIATLIEQSERKIVENEGINELANKLEKHDR